MNEERPQVFERGGMLVNKFDGESLVCSLSNLYLNQYIKEHKK
jgi:hypothetical protein